MLFRIKGEFAQGLVDYLKQRPYQQVANFITGLVELEKTEGNEAVHFKIKAELAQGLVDFLKRLPYEEVTGFIAELVKLDRLDDAGNPVQVGNPVQAGNPV